ncbi:hypothetical protein DFR68_103760 [Nocardia mexicana]|uniref:SnoaL-like protein n=2 Tax=Nocardia mexicana TaxID=279262 RepID=A0A370HAX0_9NOCA|nr:hypothetical protein DFR68_103760 [Nocardia mexicana]
MKISCGALRTDLENTDPESFAAGARSDLAARGRGTITKYLDLTVLDRFASAALWVQYERHVEGLNSNNEVQVSSVYENMDGTWRICGLN